MPRSVRRSSGLSGPTLVNTSNVVLKATVMPEWRKSFEAEDSDFAGLGAMEVYSSSEMGKCLALENARPRTRSRPKQTMISPGKSDKVRRFTLTVCRRSDDLGLIA